MRRSFYRGSLWGAAIGLPTALAIFLLDPKGDARGHVVDLGVRLLDRLRM